jgi:tartrate-resistant acid phosphatase type 5
MPSSATGTEPQPHTTNVSQYYCNFIRNHDAPDWVDCNSGLSTNRFYPSAGNHDWDSADRTLGPYRQYFTLPRNERYYDTRWGLVQLFAVDSDSREPDGITQTSIQANWLQGRLAASTAAWKIVYMHHPPYSSGQHGITPVLQWPYQQWGASAVLTGHDHTYERILRHSAPGGPCPQEPGIDPCFPYFVNGLGGNPSRYAFRPTPVPGSEARYNADWGAMYVEASPYYLFFLFLNVQTGGMELYYDYQVLVA